MTQSEAKAAIDRAFEESMGRLFGILVSNLETRNQEAEAEFQRGFEFHLRAHALATSIAEELLKA